MRTVTPDELALLQQPHVNHHLRAEVKDTDGAWRLLTQIGGVDWLDAARWDVPLDGPVITGVLELGRDRGSLSMAPFMEGSAVNRNAAGVYAPFLDVGRDLRVFTAVTFPGVPPSPTDWRPAVEAVADAIAWESDPITIPFRDVGARLLDTPIKEKRVHGSPAGTRLDVLIQELLTVNMGADAPALYTPVLPNWFLKPYEQAAGPSVLEAIRALALQIGWNVHYKYDAAHAFRLTLYQPNRDATVPLATIGPTVYNDVRKLSIALADIRNDGRIFYRDKSTGALRSVTYQDNASIAAYKRRFMQIALAASSNIDSATEATAMITAAIKDLSLPDAEQEIDLPFWWPTEIGDLNRFLANGVHYDSDQDWAVVGVSHDFRNGDGSTVIRTRGKPAGAYKRWISTRGTVSEPEVAPLGPAPIVGAGCGEGTAFGGGATREGMAWLSVTLTKETEYVLVYAFENPTSPTPIPEIAENRLAWTVRRQEGEHSSAPEWEAWIMVATKTGNYRKFLVVGVGFDGQRGPTIVREVQCVDSGTAPTGAPTSITKTIVGDAIRIGATVADVNANTFVLRNGIPLIKLTPTNYVDGLLLFEDRKVDTAVPYTYQLCHERSCQTSALVSTTTGTVAQQPRAPAWQAGFPIGVTENGIAKAHVGYTAHADTVELWLQVQGRFDSTFADFFQFVVSTVGTAKVEGFPHGTTVQTRFRARMSDGEILYSEPRATTWGQGALPSPAFAFGFPKPGGLGAPYECTFKWVGPSGAIQLVLEVGPGGGIWNAPPEFSTTNPAEIAAHQITTTRAGILSLTARLRAVFAQGQSVSIERTAVWA